MATFRDDVANLARRAGERLIEAAKERGYEVAPAGQGELLEATRNERRLLERTLDYVGSRLINQPGRGSIWEMPTDKPLMSRLALAREAHRAWQDHPMAGQYADLYVSFVFGRGGPTYRAPDPEVQDIIDEMVSEPANRRTLFGYEALLAKGIDLQITSNVFLLAHTDGADGKVQLGQLPFHAVDDAIRHPIDRYRITHYRGLQTLTNYDWTADRTVVEEGRRARVVYYEALHGFDDDNPSMLEQDRIATDLGAAIRPPAEKTGAGRVLHMAVNRTSDMAFGVPRMARWLRYWATYDRMMQTHSQRMQVVGQVLMQMTAKGTTTADQERLGHMALNAVRNPMGYGRDDAANSAFEMPTPAGPPVPGVLTGNENARFDPLKIDSGASDVLATADELRAASSGPFPATYQGTDPGAIAGNQSLELPTLKWAEMEQELWCGQVFRPIAELQIREAVRAGRLSEWRKPTRDEQQRIEYARESGAPEPYQLDTEGRIKRDLSFEVEMPSPLKRVIGDVVQSAVTAAQALDPTGTNPMLARWLMHYLLSEAFDVADPAAIVDEVLPLEQAKRQIERQQAAEDAAQAQARQAAQQPPGGDTATTTGADGQKHPVDNAYGAKVDSPPPEKRRVREADDVESAHEVLWQDADAALHALDNLRLHDLVQ